MEVIRASSWSYQTMAGTPCMGDGGILVLAKRLQRWPCFECSVEHANNQRMVAL